MKMKALGRTVILKTPDHSMDGRMPGKKDGIKTMTCIQFFPLDILPLTVITSSRQTFGAACNAGAEAYFGAISLSRV